MARKRMIDPDFWIDEKLGECSRDGRLLFMGLISNADDEGRGRANPKLLKSAIFPYDEDLNSKKIESLLNDLAKMRLCILYKVDSQEFYFLPNFSKHQVINRPTASKLPIPIFDKQLSDNSMSNQGELTPNIKEVNTKEINTKEIKGSSVNPLAEFSIFWETYPNKKAKGDAEKAWKKLKPNKELQEKIISSINNQKKSKDWLKDGGKFIPHPATWLNGERWEDELEVEYDKYGRTNEAEQGQEYGAFY